ncbi:MAG: preprotein translocase subunit SecG [Thermosediminibacterales bacterium]|nr:preprotein translocase subunit SecG [Thermosediminibacterales bacterium]
MVVNVIKVIHIILCLGLITVVLLQSGKSAGLSGSIAGGAETFFGKREGIDNVLSKFTTLIAVLFIVTSITLVVLK